MHHRHRHIINILSKRAKMFPAIGVLGPRQVGKSTFLMKEWRDQMGAVYLTFDKQEVAQRARNAPEQLLIDESQDQKIHLIIDEAQKVPHIFDSIKALIDENRRIGAFTLSGSVEFSSKSGVRESLAGRMGTTRMYPMTMRELNEQEFYSPWVDFDFAGSKSSLKYKSVETWLERGGMPIFCCFSDNDERMGTVISWLEAICFRDLKQLKGADYDSELAFNLLKAMAYKSLSPITQLSLDLGASSASIRKHLSALEALFLVYEIPSFENPRGISRYHLLDAGVINALLGGQETSESRQKCLLSLVINEIYAQYEYAGKLKPKLFHYRTRGGAEIDLIMKVNNNIIGIECMTNIDISPYRLRGMQSFLRKYNNAKGYIIAPVQEPYNVDENIKVIPWNAIG